METKHCSGCTSTKTFAEFSNNRSTKDGKDSVCKLCRKEYNIGRYNKEDSRLSLEKLHTAVIIGYGSKCACCGETARVFLTLDHVNGGGSQERKRDSHFAYRDALRRNFPSDYQALCFNCNWAKHKLGICPHQNIRVENINVT